MGHLSPPHPSSFRKHWNPPGNSRQRALRADEAEEIFGKENETFEETQARVNSRALKESGALEFHRDDDNLAVDPDDADFDEAALKEGEEVVWDERQQRRILVSNAAPHISLSEKNSRFHINCFANSILRLARQAEVFDQREIDLMFTEIVATTVDRFQSVKGALHQFANANQELMEVLSILLGRSRHLQYPADKVIARGGEGGRFFVDSCFRAEWFLPWKQSPVCRDFCAENFPDNRQTWQDSIVPSATTTANTNSLPPQTTTTPRTSRRRSRSR